MLTVGGKSNSLGKVNEVVDLVLNERSRIEELYDCLFDDDAWTRMRAADALEKVCREHPDWLLPLVDRFPTDLAVTSQPSIQWHLAQMYKQIELTEGQRRFAIYWLKELLSRPTIDWIVAANSMDTLFQFEREGFLPGDELVPLLQIQQLHKSQAVVKRASRLLNELIAR